MSDIQQQLARLLGRAVHQIRKTDENPPRISVVDVALVIRGKTQHDAAQDVRRILEHYPDVGTNCSHFRFKGLTGPPRLRGPYSFSYSLFVARTQTRQNKHLRERPKWRIWGRFGSPGRIGPKWSIWAREVCIRTNWVRHPLLNNLSSNKSFSQSRTAGKRGAPNPAHQKQSEVGLSCIADQSAVRLSCIED